MAAFLFAEEIDQLAYGFPELFKGSGHGFAQECFEFGEGLFDGIEVRRVRWQVYDGRTFSFDNFPDPRHFMRGEIIAHHDVAGLQGWRELGLQIGFKGFAGHWPVQHPRRGDPVHAQTGDEGGGAPMAAGRIPFATMAAQRASIARSHICGRARFIKKHQP